MVSQFLWNLKFNVNFCLVTPADWRVLPNTICMLWDLHRWQFMQPTSSINECIAQCEGFKINQ